MAIIIDSPCLASSNTTLWCMKTVTIYDMWYILPYHYQGWQCKCQPRQKTVDFNTSHRRRCEIWLLKLISSENDCCRNNEILDKKIAQWPVIIHLDRRAVNNIPQLARCWANIWDTGPTFSQQMNVNFIITPDLPLTIITDYYLCCILTI